MFLPAKMWVYCEFLSSEGISSSTKVLKGFATAKAIHLTCAMYIMIKCLFFLASYSNVGIRTLLMSLISWTKLVMTNCSLSIFIFA